MRVLACLLLLATGLAACSESESGGNNAAAAAPAPRRSGPPPLTPKLDIAPAPGNSDHWMAPTSNSGDPASAPFANLLDQPVVDATPKPRQP